MLTCRKNSFRFQVMAGLADVVDPMELPQKFYHALKAVSCSTGGRICCVCSPIFRFFVIAYRFLFQLVKTLGNSDVDSKFLGEAMRVLQAWKGAADEEMNAARRCLKRKHDDDAVAAFDHVRRRRVLFSATFFIERIRNSFNNIGLSSSLKSEFLIHAPSKQKFIANDCCYSNYFWSCRRR